MAGDVVLRRLTAGDADAFRALRVDGARRHPREFRFDPEDEAAIPRGQTLARLTSDVVVGAFDGGRLVGIGGLAGFAGRKVAHKRLLWGMYVAPEARGRGVARAIVDWLVERARGEGARTVLLTVADGNALARGLYERSGFVTYGVEPGSALMEGAYVDEVLMALRLAPNAPG